jgi:hypothetical protein
MLYKFRKKRTGHDASLQEFISPMKMKETMTRRSDGRNAGSLL